MQGHVRSRRGGVSGESTPRSDSDEPIIQHPKFDKSEEVLGRLEEWLKNSILFGHLGAKERREIFMYMEEQKFPKGTVVIKEGDEENTDLFYIVEEGELDVVKGEEKVFDYTRGGTFGELALMYNVPRQASVVATTDVVCWTLQRWCYRNNVMMHTKNKREKYQQFLSKVHLLANLDKYERLKIVDALIPEHFEDGETIMTQGDKGTHFYIIEEGAVKVVKNGEETENSPLVVGQYFGEVALLRDTVRQATLFANGKVKCLSLDTNAFVRLLGPCEDIMKRNIDAVY